MTLQPVPEKIWSRASKFQIISLVTLLAKLLLALGAGLLILALV